MTYIENVFVCIAAPLFITMLCVGRRYHAAFALCFAGMFVCLLSAYLNTFFTLYYQADTMNATTQIAPVVEEIMKLLPLLFFLIVAMTTAQSLLDALCTFGCFFFGYAVPVPILTNYLDWTHRIARLQNKTKSQRIWIQISLTALTQVLSVLCIIASPAT